MSGQPKLHREPVSPAPQIKTLVPGCLVPSTPGLSPLTQHCGHLRAADRQPPVLSGALRRHTEYCQVKSQVSQGTGKSKEHAVSITETSGHELLTTEAGV